MPCRHNGAVVLMVKSGTTEVNHSHCCALNSPLFSFLQDRQVFSDRVQLKYFLIAYLCNLFFFLGGGITDLAEGNIRQNQRLSGQPLIALNVLVESSC